MRRRSRGSRFTWMPMLGNSYNDGENTYNTNVLVGRLSPQPNAAATAVGNDTSVVGALVPDFTQEHTPGTLAVGESLRDYTEGQDWFLRRIVGKLVVSSSAFDTTVAQELAWPSVIVTAGFFIGRAQESAPGLPDYTSGETDPQVLENIRQPWIWRRTWVLGCAQVPSTNDATAEFSALYPNSNEEFGSALDGPHIDAKTLRRIRRFERLWYSISVMGNTSFFPNGVNGEANQQPNVNYNLDVRCLGAMRKSSNRSIF